MRRSLDDSVISRCVHCANVSSHLVAVNYKYQKYKSLARHFYEDLETHKQLVTTLEARLKEAEHQFNNKRRK
jgi:hypothetical protein